MEYLLLFPILFVNKMKMDFVKRLIVLIFSGAFLTYLGYIFQQETLIIRDGVASEWNMVMYAILALVFVYFLIVYAIRPLYFKHARIVNVLIGLGLILLGYRAIPTPTIQELGTMSSDRGAYLADIVIVLGVIITFVWWSNLLVSKKIKKQKEEANIEIIEV